MAQLIPASRAFKTSEAMRHPEREAIDHFTNILNALITESASHGKMSCRFRVPLMVSELPAYNRDKVRAGVERRLLMADYKLRVCKDGYTVEPVWGGSKTTGAPHRGEWTPPARAKGPGGLCMFSHNDDAPPPVLRKTRSFIADREGGAGDDMFVVQ